jgi:hypothetical protein
MVYTHPLAGGEVASSTAAVGYPEENGCAERLRAASLDKCIRRII